MCTIETQKILHFQELHIQCSQIFSHSDMELQTKSTVFFYPLVVDSIHHDSRDVFSSGTRQRHLMLSFQTVICLFSIAIDPSFDYIFREYGGLIAIILNPNEEESLKGDELTGQNSPREHQSMWLHIRNDLCEEETQLLSGSRLQ